MPRELSDKELAEFFEARRGDMSLWSDRPVRARRRQGGTVTVSIRFARDELAWLKLRAEAEDITLSDLIRRAALQPKPEKLSIAWSIQGQHLEVWGGDDTAVRHERRVEVDDPDLVAAGTVRSPA